MARKPEPDLKVVKPIPENLQKALEDLKIAIADPERKKVLEGEVAALEKEIEELEEKIGVLKTRKREVSNKVDEIEEAENRISEIRASLEEA